MRSRNSLKVIAATIAVAIAGVLSIMFAQSAMAGGPSVDGLWSAKYSLSCSGSLDQSGSDVTGSLVCSEDIALDVSGVLSADGAVTLVGTFGGIAVTVNGDLSEGGDAIEGEWSAPPLVENGNFIALREGDPSTEDIDGFWLITAEDIFSNDCTVDIDQSGPVLNPVLSADVDCANGPSGMLAGDFEPATGNLNMAGPFGSVGTLEVRVNMAEDGQSYNGVWRLLPDGPAGTMNGERLREQADLTPAEPEEATPTPSVQLPDTGAGTPGGSMPWVVPAIAAMLFAGAGLVFASYRLR